MTVKKAGCVVAGVVAAMIALTPIASATEAPHGHDGKQCSFVAGSSGADSSITGDSLANAVAQAPVGGNNAANVGNCSDFLNNNLNGNLSGNDVDVLGGVPDLLPLP
ncbi:hypothetical protein [Pseudonocardia endophytica]|uniref:Small secreted domain DUF320 n=1 Tax=Pseudonocardia endophytica TaxID=401976 RepID=A0A4R1HVI9_PSEEN|nr:hypothetical protein [Pseudonocardia endophytica]TCK24720.1 hypothetical protein EV378_0510 [Pseudonocardia endophytica]